MPESRFKKGDKVIVTDLEEPGEVINIRFTPDPLYTVYLDDYTFADRFYYARENEVRAL